MCMHGEALRQLSGHGAGAGAAGGLQAVTTPAIRPRHETETGKYCGSRECLNLYV
jgi:hypothetical protein